MCLGVLLRKHSTDKRRGFTLIEVMIVIVIMGLLAGIAVPNIMGLIERSRENIDRLKLFYLREALNRALVDDANALMNTAYTSGNKANQDSLTKYLKGTQGVTLFVIEVKNGVSINVQGSHGKANNSVNMCQLIGDGGTWYNALMEAGFEGVADIVASRLDKTDYSKLDQSNTSYYAKKDGSNWRTYPKSPMFISKALNQGDCSGNYRLTMNFRWSGGDASSRSVEVALLPSSGNMNNKAFKTEHGVCFSTEGDNACKSFSKKCD
ncbi:MAG: prepilin-type N-terminal cleavage/methylation domain-containing protein [Fibrobacter sp.]|nr:prepilin-type N-terminal cleavage/methylation domain-containing protein [Fibrobacter sp.]MBR2469983.1 prepilin-type N-terminal cleavage/methylation domain-containing protein [Fibrobacter sp.]